MQKADTQPHGSLPREAVLSAIEYLIILALIATPLFLFQVYTSHFPGYVAATENLSIAVPYSNIRLDYLGFILPLAISIPLIVLIRKEAHVLFEGRLKKITLAFAVLYAAVGLLSLKYPLMVTISTGSGLLPLEVLAGVYIFCISISKPDMPRLIAPTAYILGAVTGALSDMILTVASPPIQGVWILGAYGLLDGDFIMPLAFLLTSLLLMAILGRRKA
jgi:hypothetical protein